MEKKNFSLADAGIIFVAAFVLAQVTSLLGVFVTQTILQAVGMSTEKISAFWDTAFGYLLQTIYLNIAFVLVFVWYYKRRKHNALIQKPTNSTYKYFGYCAILGVATLFLSSGVLNYFQLFVDKLGLTPSTLGYELDSPTNYLISLVSLALIPAVCEELVFRGLLTTALKQKGKIFAVILSSIMFSIFHFSPSQLLYPIMFGLILSVVYLKTNNIIFPILLHFINNALTVSIQYFSKTEATAFTHSTFNLMYAIITFAIWIVAMYYLFKDFKKGNASNNQDDDSKQNQEQNQPISNSDDKMNKIYLYGSIAIMLVLYVILALL